VLDPLGHPTSRPGRSSEEREIAATGWIAEAGVVREPGLDQLRAPRAAADRLLGLEDDDDKPARASSSRRRGRWGRADHDRVMVLVRQRGGLQRRALRTMDPALHADRAAVAAPGSNGCSPGNAWWRRSGRPRRPPPCTSARRRPRPRRTRSTARQEPARRGQRDAHGSETRDRQNRHRHETSTHGWPSSWIRECGDRNTSRRR
jgi:hypothetical protein